VAYLRMHHFSTLLLADIARYIFSLFNDLLSISSHRAQHVIYNSQSSTAGKLLLTAGKSDQTQMISYIPPGNPRHPVI